MAGRPPKGSATGKQRLLDACWELIVELPVADRLTIASVCERAKCTPPTLYHHFGDLEALEHAASLRAYAARSDEVVQICTTLANPKQRVCEMARAYLSWAQDHPDAYHVLFSQPRKATSSNVEPLNFPGFRSMLQDLAEIHGLEPSDPAAKEIALTFWTGVHGIASLAVSMPILTEKVQRSLLDVITAAVVAPDPPPAKHLRAVS